MYTTCAPLGSRRLYNASILTAASALGILASVQSPAQNMTPSAASPLDLVNGLQPGACHMDPLGISRRSHL